MKLIAHRGNTNGIFEHYENEPTYIDLAIDRGFDVEVDVWLKDKILWLGHDKPDYGINPSWFKDRKDNLWIHAKNFEALNYFIDLDWARVFYHELEKHTIIGNSGLIWSHDLTEASTKSIIPLLNLEDVNNWEEKEVYGVCSDYVEILKNIKKNTKK
jgi:hypothetical protein